MIFGTRLLSDNKTEFNFWAPDSKIVNLCLKNSDGKSFELQMNQETEGWFNLITDKAPVSAEYMFQIDNGLLVPDPASRFQKLDVHNASLVINPNDFNWENDSDWKGRPWHEAVIYEIHTGTFTKEGTFKAIEEKLDYLVSLGVTAIQLMPVSDFPGKRNWGYDGVLHFAPDNTYGTPNDLKNLIKTAHEKGVMVFLDVVYNHFGPEGNYLYVYAKSKFFNHNEKTPWGDAINFDDRNVRNFFIQNALYWLAEYHFDGLRFDAVHTIKDSSEIHILEEIFQAVKEKIQNRHVHLILENDNNEAKRLENFTAQWNDDFHHAAHVLITGEESGYYEDYSNKKTPQKPVYYLAKCLAEGFAYQGEVSAYRNGLSRGENSKNLLPTSFINFLQNHDQIGNRPFGERLNKISSLNKLKAIICINLLAPSIPLLFMGEEFGCEQPFNFFCDFEENLSKAVKEGREKEFSAFHKEGAILTKIPDATSEKTFAESKIDWNQLKQEKHGDLFDFYRKIIELRKKHIIPLIPEIEHSYSSFEILGEDVFSVTWQTKTNQKLELLANLSDKSYNQQGKNISVCEVLWLLNNENLLLTEEKTACRFEVPRSTYRIQLNKDFTFKDAEKIVPYLSELGISHCYLSPILTARAGSLHGYDIIDHSSINPELGGEEEFNDFVDTVKQYNMGIILDIVPNHMGIGNENKWWNDVLENGQASEYADFFDIDWNPIKKELTGKVLVPILGDHYGNILANGELKLHFDKEFGRLKLIYHEHEFPINPSSYPLILEHRINELENVFSNNDNDFLEYLSINTVFKNLPKTSETSYEKIKERNREKQIAYRRLSQLYKNNEIIANFIESNLLEFKCQPDKHSACQKMHNLLEKQAYRLAYWRVSSDIINYRRFFDVNALIGLKTENPLVFNQTHSLILELIEQNKINGLRIDHPDGLLNPSEYFKTLQFEIEKRLGISDRGLKEKFLSSEHLPFYIIAEKILAPFEKLPNDWAISGTTGYESLNNFGNLLIDNKNAEKFTRIYHKFIKKSINFNELVIKCKKTIMKTALTSELSTLCNHLGKLTEKCYSTRDYTLNSLREALIEIISCFPVYRTYISEEDKPNKAINYIKWAVGMAKKRSMSTDPSIYDFIEKVLLCEFETNTNFEAADEILNFTMKFQQYTAPLMAKGLEDTGFYNYNRLISLNEVGSSPANFGISVNDFHNGNLYRQSTTPHGLLASSTHDTKLSEDVRARLCILSEIPEIWQKKINKWSKINRSKKTKLENSFIPDKNDEYLFYQVLTGIWTNEVPNREGVKNLTERLENYMIKAIREAKTHTSWININIQYENALSEFIKRVLNSPENHPFWKEFLPFQKEIALKGINNSIFQSVLKFTSPGVPDVYQGCESLKFSMVDPDNRTNVDFNNIQRLLNEIKPSIDNKINDISLFYPLESGKLKLFITSILLNFRKEHPDLFKKGNYLPLEIKGAKSENLVAFARNFENETVIIIVPRLVYNIIHNEKPFPIGFDAWKDTEIILPEEYKHFKWQDIFTKAEYYSFESELKAGNIINMLPAVVLYSLSK